MEISPRRFQFIFLDRSGYLKVAPEGKFWLYEGNDGMFAGRLMPLDQGQLSFALGEIFPAMQCTLLYITFKYNDLGILM